MIPHRFAAVLLAVALSCALPALAADDTVRTAAWFEAHRDRPPLLRQFLQRMPKGADLHSHLSGAVYAESYLRLAAENGYCVTTDKLALVPPPCSESDTQVPAGKLSASASATLVDRMSMRNATFAGRSGHDQFFAAFGVFGGVSGDASLQGAMADELVERAAAQHVLHVEVMITFQGSPVRTLAAGLPKFDGNDFSAQLQYLNDQGLGALVEKGRAELAAVEASMRELQHCGTPAAKPGCEVSVRWLQQTTRTGPPEQVFAQLAFAFELARQETHVAGINLVAPEDNAVALRDYRLQMEMIGFLSHRAPDVRIALHAGELTLGLVAPEHLRGHIRDAVTVAGARRIGHAVDIGFEDDARGTLAAMRDRHVAVEICLTSNDAILGVRGRDHPLPDYLAAKVPVVLASDDEGISRIDLGNEYLRAALDYRLGYRVLKQIARNGLEYSFLPGDSLWQDAGRAIVQPACRGQVADVRTPSAACTALLDGSERARRQWVLESEFAKFEKLSDWRNAAR